MIPWRPGRFYDLFDDDFVLQGANPSPPPPPPKPKKKGGAISFQLVTDWEEIEREEKRRAEEAELELAKMIEADDEEVLMALIGADRI